MTGINRRRALKMEKEQNPITHAELFKTKQKQETNQKSKQEAEAQASAPSSTRAKG